jgi:uncharacterized protein YndB with AHSA1/START domain
MTMADIQHSIQIAAKPESVYPLVATAEGLSRWWAADIVQSDGSLDLGFFGRTTVYRLRLANSAPNTSVDWICESGHEWSGTHLVFRLEAGGPGTILRFAHSGWQSATDYFTACNTTWGALMFRIKAAAEGKSPGPLFLADSMAY